MPRILLTHRDEALFRWLWMLRVMTVKQIRRAHFFQPETGVLSNVNNVRMRLKRMEDEGYLRGEMIRPENADQRQKIYFLDQKALFSLAQFGIIQKRTSDFKDLNAYRQIYHALMISECATRVWEQIRQTEVQLASLAPFHLPFYHTHAVGNRNAKIHVARFISQFDVTSVTHSQPFRIRPDLVFGLEKEGVGRLFFLEADRGFEGHQEISTKQEGYFHYAMAPMLDDSQCKLWQSYGDMKDFRVLFVTTSEQRIENLWASLQNKPGFNLWAMTTFEALQKHDPVFDSIWKTSDGSERALMKRRLS